jgi:hypothetical protein
MEPTQAWLRPRLRPPREVPRLRRVFTRCRHGRAVFRKAIFSTFFSSWAARVCLICARLEREFWCLRSQFRPVV